MLNWVARKEYFAETPPFEITAARTLSSSRPELSRTHVAPLSVECITPSGVPANIWPVGLTAIVVIALESVTSCAIAAPVQATTIKRNRRTRNIHSSLQMQQNYCC